MVRETGHVSVPVGLGSARSRRKSRTAAAETRNERWRAAITAIARVVIRRTAATTKAGHEVGEGWGTATASERRYDGTLSRVRNEVVGGRIEARAGSRARLRSWGVRSSVRSR